MPKKFHRPTVDEVGLFGKHPLDSAGLSPVLPQDHPPYSPAGGVITWDSSRTQGLERHTGTRERSESSLPALRPR